jgi:hypothetical protein
MTGFPLNFLYPLPLTSLLIELLFPFFVFLFLSVFEV